MGTDRRDSYEGTPLETDVLVVGAGAAGCTLGYLLRLAGAGVAVVELCDLARKDKLCGGALGQDATRLIEEVFGEGSLDELGVFRPRRVVRRSLDRQLAYGCKFATVERRRLDGWLLQRYLEAGGTVRDRLRVDAIDAHEHVAVATDLRTRGRVRIEYGSIVGADGASSAVRRLLAGRRQRTIVSVEGQVPPSCPDIVFSYHPAKVGYCWHIPTGAGANVGCCLYGEGVRACREWLAGFCEETGLRPRALRGAPIPTGDDALLAPAQDAWLIGDAAGLVSPSVSGGIHHALASAAALAASLGGGAPYEEAMAPALDHMARSAEHVAQAYLLTSLAIARRGEVAQPAAVPS